MTLRTGAADDGPAGGIRRLDIGLIGRGARSGRAYPDLEPVRARGKTGGVPAQRRGTPVAHHRPCAAGWQHPVLELRRSAAGRGRRKGHDSDAGRLRARGIGADARAATR